MLRARLSSPRLTQEELWDPLSVGCVLGVLAYIDPQVWLWLKLRFTSPGKCSGQFSFLFFFLLFSELKAIQQIFVGVLCARCWAEP